LEILAAGSAVATAELLVGHGCLRPAQFLPLNDDGADAAADVDELVEGAADVSKVHKCHSIVCLGSCKDSVLKQPDNHFTEVVGVATPMDC